MGKVVLIAGPCAIESRTQAFRIAKFVATNGATIFRGGAWKGQNRPVVNGKPAYWGLGKKAISILTEIQVKIGIPCITEIQSECQAEWSSAAGIQYLQVGARHCQNFPLLRYLAKNTTQTIILKRGLGNTVDEWLGAAEHLGGPNKVILCERGTVHFDRTQTTRWRLDIVGVAYIKRYTKYRIIVDPSHGSGDRKLTLLLTKSILPIADGLMVEVHYDPDKSPTDAKQTIDFDEFKKVSYEYRKMENAGGYK